MKESIHTQKLLNEGQSVRDYILAYAIRDLGGDPERSMSTTIVADTKTLDEDIFTLRHQLAAIEGMADTERESYAETIRREEIERHEKIINNNTLRNDKLRLVQDEIFGLTVASREHNKMLMRAADALIECRDLSHEYLGGAISHLQSLKSETLLREHVYDLRNTLWQAEASRRDKIRAAEDATIFLTALTASIP